MAALRAAAHASGCEIALAVAEIQETYDGTEPFDEPYWYSEFEDEEPDSFDEKFGADQPNDLLDWSISLDRWMDQSGQPAQPVATAVSGEEVCGTTPSSKLTPYDSEYTGYMGNYGNTVDRWYRRGAVVLWPRSLDFAVRAEASPRWALDRLAAVLRDGEPVRARELAGLVAPFWAVVVGAALNSAQRYLAVPADLPRGQTLAKRCWSRTALITPSLRRWCCVRFVASCSRPRTRRP